MKYPQVVVCAFDDWLANQLRELVAEHRWLLRETRQPSAALDLVRQSRPTVLLVQADPDSEKLDPLRLVADAHRRFPDVACVVLSDAKMPEDERAAWTAGVLDLGARFVLFPPLMRPVLEDLLSGLMDAVARRVMGEAPPKAEAAIDLADTGHEDP
jgi:hypothetical protein